MEQKVKWPPGRDGECWRGSKRYDHPPTGGRALGENVRLAIEMVLNNFTNQEIYEASEWEHRVTVTNVLSRCRKRYGLELKPDLHLGCRSRISWERFKKLNSSTYDGKKLTARMIASRMGISIATVYQMRRTLREGSWDWQRKRYRDSVERKKNGKMQRM